MAPVPRTAKRIKVSSITKAKKKITTLDKTGFDENDVAKSSKQAKMSFRCPVTIENVFSAPTAQQIEQFYEARVGHEKPFDRLPEADKLAWAESLHDNTTLIGYIIYSQLFPSLLNNRIKLNSASYHWAHLDKNTEKGRIKLEQRRNAVDRLNRIGSTASVFRGLPYTVDNTENILKFMKMDLDRDDERSRFLASREFSVIFSERGQVGSSSVYASCSMALSLLWFATAVLGRPCCIESIVLPLSTAERRTLEQRFSCHPRFLDGPIKSFETKWRTVFGAIGTPHRDINYVMLERASEHKYVGGIHVADAYAVYRATLSAPGDLNGITALMESYKQHSKHGVESGSVVGVIDIIRQKPMEAIGRIDGSVIGAISSTFGEKVSLEVQARCTSLEDGSSLFDGSIRDKLCQIMAYFDAELWKARKKHKVERKVACNVDPAGMAKKLEGGRMLDPTDPKSVELMHDMLKALSRQVWKPLKTMIGEALGSSFQCPTTFLQISEEETEQLYGYMQDAGVVYSDIANLCTLLLLSFSFQRSQVLRDSTVNEFVLVPDGSQYKFSFKDDRRFKTASSGGSSSALPLSHFILSPHQSMIIKFLTVGHRFCGVKKPVDEKRRLFLNSSGLGWTQRDIYSRYKRIGKNWLNISNFGAHVCRTFWATSALNTGQIDEKNVDDLSSHLQVSSTTLRNSYAAAGANSAAQNVGNEVLGGIVNAACVGDTNFTGDRPNGKKLKSRRLEFEGDIRASLLKHDGDWKLLFKILVEKRNACRLVKGEKWFRWENRFFGDGDERLFQRFLGKIGM